ncbi:insulin-like growth factor-binding protein complex acid labile subunit isoform X2 [Eupeodes corollae]|uniref:insulin-like growth factor-binding protein complex acid labile subunit isoform X2 n=1 Tax=Eupeodes corollae TaxID=290404 RepID=UPI0024922737|nr:insulin-like growth factor-binding protein complex acid labile subunit isoform X2 [Eupeodes corollae]
MDNVISILVLLLTLILLKTSSAQHEDIPYQNVEDICETCSCINAHDADSKFHHMLDCSVKNFNHILPRWPKEFGLNHKGVDIVATFSGNKIELLQQLPATNGSLSFSCRHCTIKDIQAPTFMDVPNIIRLDLSWNEITSDVLSPDLFRGPYKNTGYEPIKLQELDLSHNKISFLQKFVFEHTPDITKLNLGYNDLRILGTSSLFAISSATTLEFLDLSYNNLESLPSTLFKDLIALKSLLVQGNKLKAIPPNLNLIGRTLEYVNFAGNPIKTLNEANLNGLKVLRKLNISSMGELTTIEKGTFSHLESLEYLYCSRNPYLTTFDIDGLLHCRNLTALDVSYCKLETISINVDLSNALPSNFTAQWPKLQTIGVVGNPWTCDCNLMRILEFCGKEVFKNDKHARCHWPFGLSGVRISNLTSDFVCNLPEEYIVPEQVDPPKFLRRRYIVSTVVTISLVIFVGVLVGFSIVFIHRRLKRDDYGIAPIRYTSVRVSNQSAMSIIK